MKHLNISGDIVSSDYGDAYAYFGWDYASPKSVRSVLDTLEDGEELRIHINSGGGEVFSGVEIYSALREVKNSVCYIESLAGSAASIIAMAGKKILMSPTAMIMIHNVSTCVAGNHSDLEKMAKDIHEMDKALANAYVEKTGMEKDKILNLMEKESWLTSDRSIELGFADGIIENDMLLTAGSIRMTPEMFEEFKNMKNKTSEAELLRLSIL